MEETLKELSKSLSILNGTLGEIRDLMKAQLDLAKKPMENENAEKLLSKLTEFLPTNLKIQ